MVIFIFFSNYFVPTRQRLRQLLSSLRPTRNSSCLASVDASAESESVVASAFDAATFANDNGFAASPELLDVLVFEVLLLLLRVFSLDIFCTADFLAVTSFFKTAANDDFPPQLATGARPCDEAGDELSLLLSLFEGPVVAFVSV
jgi:hypothetical protein